MTAHEIHALSGAYAVDALDDLERAHFEAHLALCAECRAEVASLQDTAAMFSTTSEVAPPAAMRDKLLADIKSVRPLPPLVARLDARRPRRWAGRLVAAAAVLGIAGGGFSVWQQTHDDTHQVVQNAADEVMNAADVTTVSKSIGNGTNVKVYRSEKLGRAAVKVSGLPKAPTGKVYELWLRNAHGTMIKAGFLTGSGTRDAPFDGDASDATGAGISVEPEGGSQQPTILYAIVPFEKSV
jgi:anti-sigma-K factor RskA